MTASVDIRQETINIIDLEKLDEFADLDVDSDFVNKTFVQQ